MTEITFSSDMTVKLVHSDAKDDYVIQAAQVSATGENNPETVPFRFINALMKQRHGSTFEHNSFTFFVKVPIFISREWLRHRIASYNEMSGRYTKLHPEFYIPGPDRKAYNIGTKMKPEFVDIETARAAGKVPDWHIESENGKTWPALKATAQYAWDDYEAMIESGIANEVARMVLPLNIYTQFYFTTNARSLMNFLSLRVQSDESLVKSYPQKEINDAADQVEKLFAEKMPFTHLAFVENGRVAP